MENTLKLKSLVIITFFIFLLPFLRTCSDKNIPKYIIEESEVLVGTETIVKDSAKNEAYKNETIAKQEAEFTENFYSLIYKTFGKTKLKDYDKSILEDKAFYPLFGFLIIFFVSILNLIFTFFKKYKKTYILGITNLVLLILATFGLVYSEIVESLNQFKIGYYLLTLNFILIVIISKKKRKKEGIL